MSSRTERLARLAGSGKGWGGGLPLPQLFAAILNELLDNETMSTSRAVEIATDVLGFKTNQIITNQAMGGPRAPVPDWESFTGDVLAQMEDRHIIRRDGDVWRTGDKFNTGVSLEIIPAGGGRNRDGVTVWDKGKREADNHVSWVEAEAERLIRQPRSGPHSPQVMSKLRESAREYGQLSPVLTDANGRIVDGRHRHEIDPTWRTDVVRRADGQPISTDDELLAAMLELDWWKQHEGLPPKAREAIKRILGELPGVNEVKRRRVDAALRQDASQSNRQIAETLGVDHTFVVKVRDSLVSDTTDKNRIHDYVFPGGGRGPRAGKHSAACWCGEGDAESKQESSKKAPGPNKTPDAVVQQIFALYFASAEGTEPSGMTQQEIAKRVGLDHSTVSSLVRKEAEARQRVAQAAERKRKEEAAERKREKDDTAKTVDEDQVEEAEDKAEDEEESEPECTHCCPRHCPP